jgi:alkylation response protein AidB-like acyl-CoA dehydrogenase
MHWKFPTDCDEKRQVLLKAVEQVRGTLQAGADAAEANATLPQATVQALDDAGLFALKLPAVLGGAEADLVTQLEVLEAISYIDTSAGWCTLIGAAAIASPGAFLGNEAIAQMFAGGQVPRAAGAFMPSGRAVPVDGGYRVSGRWAFASGIQHAQWVSATVRVIQDSAATPALRRVVVPVAAVQIHNNWQVMGLQGTGSCDFSLTDLFVPAHFSWDVQRDRPQRGGPLYRLGMPAFVSNEHVAFALGVGRRALDTLLDLAQSKQRGYGQASTLAARPAVQRALGESELRLRAARALAVETYEKAWATVCAGQTLPPRLQAELRSVATLATEVAVEVTTQMFRYSGGTALYTTSVLQRCLRDINAAAQHLMVSDAAYENYGQFLLGLPDADPMR